MTLAILLLVHGAIHLLGAAKGFGLAEVAELRTPIAPREAVLWLGVAVLLVVASGMRITSHGPWWAVALPGILLSQALILGAWQDARWGTVANLLILLPLILAAADARSGSLRSRYAEQSDAVRRALDGPSPALVTEADLAASGMPAVVQRYIRESGAVGRPRVRWFEARMTGRIRGAPDEAWMNATVRQVSRVDPAVRLYFMEAVKSGFPAQVLHHYGEGQATMQVRLLGLLPLVDADGPVMLRSETVTVLNDLILLAPAALLELELEWTVLGPRRVRVGWENAGERVSAEVIFDEEGRLENFISDDRSQWQGDERPPVSSRWSTPIRRYDTFHGRRGVAEAVARWGEVPGSWVYAEFVIDDVRMNGGPEDGGG